MWRRTKVVVLGQILSMLVTGTAFSSSQLARHGIDAPTLQSSFTYLLLFSFNGSCLLRRRKPLKAPWYLYLLLGVIDMEGNYLVVKAYQYTSITSVMLLDCWSIPCVLLLTWCLLKTGYLRGHIVGVLVCILGLALVVFSDAHVEDRSGGSNVLLGDSLVFVGATLYAIANVLEEFLIKQVDRTELLAMVGAFGTVTSVCQVILLERHELKTIQLSTTTILPFTEFADCAFAMYTLAPTLLQVGGSAMLNLSLLTSDMYAIGIRIILFHQKVDWLYFVAFATVAVGIVYYSLSGEPDDSRTGSPTKKEIAYEAVDTSAHSDDPRGSELAESSSKAEGGGGTPRSSEQQPLSYDQAV